MSEIGPIYKNLWQCYNFFWIRPIFKPPKFTEKTSEQMEIHLIYKNLWHVALYYRFLESGQFGYGFFLKLHNTIKYRYMNVMTWTAFLLCIALCLQLNDFPKLWFSSITWSKDKIGLDPFNELPVNLSSSIVCTKDEKYIKINKLKWPVD